MFKNPSQIDALKPKASPYIKADANGLVIHVAASGTKTWRLRYSVMMGYERVAKTMTLGQWPHMTISAARIEADRLRALLADGKDPMVTRAVQVMAGNAARGVTLDVVFEELMHDKEHVDKRKPGTLQQIRDRYTQRVKPKLGKLPIEEFTAPLLKSWCKDALAKWPGSARHTAMTVREIFGLATRMGYITFNPAADIHKNFPATEPTRRPAITDLAAFTGFMVDVSEIADPYNAKLLHLQIILYTRPVELAQAPWTEFDLDAALWTIPAERTKTGAMHIVPLPRQAVKLLRELKIARPGSPWVIPKGRKLTVCSHKDRFNHVMAKYMPQYKGQQVPHGFRSSAATLLGEAGWNPWIIERSLGHALPTAVMGVYQQARWLDYQRGMRQAWADALDAMTKGNAESAARVLRLQAGKFIMAA